MVTILTLMGCSRIKYNQEYFVKDFVKDSDVNLKVFSIDSVFFDIHKTVVIKEKDSVVLFMEFDSINKRYVPREKEVFKKEKQNETSEEYYEVYKWNNSEEKYVLDKKTRTEIKTQQNHQNKIISEFIYEYDINSGQQTPSQKLEFIYDENNIKTHSLNYHWKEETKSFLLVQKTIMEYEDGLLMSSYYVIYDSSCKDFFEKYGINDEPSEERIDKWTFNYDNDGNKIQSENFSSSCFDDELKPEFKYKNIYDKDYLSTQFIYRWDDRTNSYYEYEKNEFIFKPSEYIKTSFDYSSKLKMYKPIFKEKFSKETHGNTNKIEVSYYNYDSNFNKWILLEEGVYYGKEM